MRYVAIATTIGLGTALAAVVTTSPVAASDRDADLLGRSFEVQRPRPLPERAGTAAQLLSASATFTARASGAPRPGSRADQQLLPGARIDISYGYHWETDVLTYHFEARPESAGLRPGSAAPDTVAVGLGVFAGTSCTIDTVDVDITSQNFPDHLLYGSGDATQTPNAGRWDCAVLLVQNQDGSVVHDAWVSPLTVVTATPRLSVRAPRRDRLVKGVWTRIPVEVTNASEEGIDARDVAVDGTGKGVKVRPASFGALDGQDEVAGHVWAKLVRAKARLRLAVSEKGELLDRSTVALRQRPAPAPPRAGQWSARGVGFAVRGGKVRAFRIATQTTCGGYPDLPTTTNNTYSFKTVRIPRNNEVVGTERGNQGGDAAYSAYLELEFVSRTKVKGKFSYHGPARCTAFDSFTARRKR
jgi:hypothetical protein